MSFHWARFLTLAEELVQDCQDEARLRSAISRAYYAVFGSARDYLATHDYNISRRATAHRQIQDAFYDFHDARWQRVAREIERLRDDRLLADYEELVMDIDKTAEKCVARAKRVLRDLGYA